MIRKNRKRKKKLLQQENVSILDMVVQQFKETLFDKFKTTYPLVQLRKHQISLQSFVSLEDSLPHLETIGGVDVSYQGRDAYAAYVTFNYHTHDIINTKTTHTRVHFPYIPTYLAYQELPIIKKLIKGFRPSILLIDGHGISHPYHIGFASHLGIVINLPTIGVAKNLLCGNVSPTQTKHDPAPIIYKGKMVGWTLYPHGTHKPIFISPGHKISLSTSLKIIKKMCQHRIPEPLRIAHLMARKKMMNI